MRELYVKQADLAIFADEQVNLHRDDVKAARDQVNRLRDRLGQYIDEHPDYCLIKMLSSGSVAKGTALKTINDMDVAVYVQASQAPTDETRLLEWLAAGLREAYAGILEPDQFVVQTHCVTVSFRGSGLDVDVAPVVYEGASDDRGYLITRDTGQRVLTSIPLHLAFIRKRKDRHPQHYTQVVRFLKWWVRQEKVRRPGFRFKSFMIELLCAHLADTGLDLSDYPRAIERSLAYIVKSELRERIAFSDYYDPSTLPTACTAPIEMFDPVNPQNNVAALYTDYERLTVLEAASDAVDAIAEAQYATTKQRALDRWKVILGPSFKV